VAPSRAASWLARSPHPCSVGPGEPSRCEVCGGDGTLRVAAGVRHDHAGNPSQGLVEPRALQQARYFFWCGDRGERSDRSPRVSMPDASSRSTSLSNVYFSPSAPRALQNVDTVRTKALASQELRHLQARVANPVELAQRAPLPTGINPETQPGRKADRPRPPAGCRGSARSRSMREPTPGLNLA
jgi:hypothetical protein